MLAGRSSAGRLARGLRGFASKKKPDFYKSNPSSEPATAAKNPVPQQAADASAASKAPQAAAEAAKPATGASAPPAATAAARPTPPPAASTSPTGASIASAPSKPAASAAPPSGSTTSKAAAAPAPQAAKPASSDAAALGPAAAIKPAVPAASAPAATQAAKPAAPTASAPAAAASSARPAATAGSGRGAPGGGGGNGNGWLLHPSLPVDVRLLTGGLVGAAALAYTLTRGGDKPQAPKPAALPVEEPGFTMQPEAAAAEAEAAAAAEEAVEQAVDEAVEEAAAEAAAEEAAGAAGGAEPAAAAADRAVEAEDGGASEPVYVDASKVLGVIEEVFSKEATEQLAALEAEAAAHAASAGEHGAADAGGAADAAAEAPTPAGLAAPAGGAQEAQRAAGRQRGKTGGGGAAARRAEEQVAALQAAMADQAGEAVASDFVQSRRNPPSLAALAQGGKKAAGEALAAPAAPAVPAETTEPSPDAAAQAKQLLGLQQDLSAAGLIAEAVRLGMGPSQDWSDYEQRHRQAEVDAVVLSRLLEAAGRHVAAQLAAARADAEAGRAEVAAARRQLAEQAESFRSLLREALARAEEQQRQQLRRQAEQLTAAHAEMTVQERVDSAARLDAVRERVNALESAFRQRSDEQRTSHAAHQLSLAASSLQAALAAGQPLGQALVLLQGLAEQDPVVAAALRAVPASAAAAPVPTRAQLSDRFLDVARLSRQLSMLPEGRGGMLSLAVAKLAAALKVAERGPLAAALPGDGIDRRLAAAQQAVVDGRLLAAAAELEAAARGTAAAPVVAAWAAAVRDRAAAEQSAALLEAHAAAETASFV